MFMDTSSRTLHFVFSWPHCVPLHDSQRLQRKRKHLETIAGLLRDPGFVGQGVASFQHTHTHTHTHTHALGTVRIDTAFTGKLITTLGLITTFQDSPEGGSLSERLCRTGAGNPLRWHPCTRCEARSPARACRASRKHTTSVSTVGGPPRSPQHQQRRS